MSYPGLESHPTHGLAASTTIAGCSGPSSASGSRAAARRAGASWKARKLLSHLANIGDAKSLVIHPATTTHSQLTAEEQIATGVTDDFVRLVVGIEYLEDIVADIDQALAKA